MDLEDLRRKRMRLFAPANEQPSSHTPPNIPSAAPLAGQTAAEPIDLTTMDDDEELARQLQAEFDLQLPKQGAFEEPLAPFGAYPAPPAKKEKKKRQPKRVEEPEIQRIDLSSPSPAQDADVSDEATEVRSFANQVLGIKCACCGEKVVGGQQDLLRQFRSQLKMSQKTATAIGALSGDNVDGDITARTGISIACSNCKASTCLGCGEKLQGHMALSMNSTAFSGAGKEEFGVCGDGLQFVWHCDQARLVHVWFLLCGYDHSVKHNKPQQSTMNTKKSKRGGGIGYGRLLDDLPPPISSLANSTGLTLGSPPGPSNAISSFSGGIQKTFTTFGSKFGSLAPKPPKPYASFYGQGHTLGDDTAPSKSTYGSALDETNIGGEVKPGSTQAFPKLGTGTGYSPDDDDEVLMNMEDDYDDEGTFDEDDFDEGDFDEGGFGSGKSGGYGAYKLAARATKFDQKARPEKPAHIDPDDDITAKVMAALTLLLPSVERDVPTTFDFEPFPVLISMLLRSSILDKAAELLRNDSLDDMIGRGGLYESVLSFVKALSSHLSTSAAVVHNQRIINQAGHDLLKVSVGQPTRMVREKQDTSRPLASCLTNLHISAKMMIDSVKINESDFQTEESQHLLYLCRSVCDLAEFMEANAFSKPRVPLEKKAPATLIVAPREFAEALHRELGMMELPDDVILSQSIYKKEASEMGDPPVGRMRQLIKEITRLKTSLPPGIFVRYGETRLDVMKILIVGPKGTPYENGLWEFDLCCGLNFPNEPPIMTFKTTGGGRARVNPNLYNNGKVCLSLLGTWSGEKWKPGVSTLLQVLVSIQAMIFCDNPYCNEPGFEGEAESKASKDYNRGVYPVTLKYAMLEWLGVKTKEAPYPHAYMGEYPAMIGGGRRLNEDETAGNAKKGAGIWDEVVKKHFDACGGEVLQTVDGWIKDKAGSRRSNFAGTGWGGQTLGGEAAPLRGLSSAADTLAGKLQGALRQLE